MKLFTLSIAPNYHGSLRGAEAGTGCSRQGCSPHSSCLGWTPENLHPGPADRACLSGSAWSLSPRPLSLPTPTQAQSCFAPLLCDWWGGLCAFRRQELDHIFIPSTGYSSVVFLLSGSRRFVSESGTTHCQVGSESAFTCCLHCLRMGLEGLSVPECKNVWLGIPESP